VSRLSDADGEQQETQHWVDTTMGCGYLTGPIRDELVDEFERIGRMLPCMADKADLFCGSSVRCVGEGTVEYFVHRSPITDYGSPITDHLSSYSEKRNRRYTVDWLPSLIYGRFLGTNHLRKLFQGKI